MSPFTTSEELDLAHTTLTKTFQTGRTKSLAWRKWQLKQIWWMIDDNEARIAKALHSDLHRHDFESYYMDIGGCKKDVLLHLSKLEEWATNEVPDDAGLLFGTLCKGHIRKEPLGVALIMAAWNFPFILIIMPMVAAISAGNCCMLKPSEIASASQDLMVQMVKKYMDPEAIQMVTGGPGETKLILEKKFNHIFFTGSPGVGKIVQLAAAKNLTPTVLELGGQAPAIVSATANIDLAAKRVAFHKYLNAGQICLAPNHAFVDPAVYDAFITRVTYWIDLFMSSGGKDNIARIVNDRNYDRIASLLDDTKGTIAVGGKRDKETRYMMPTLIRDVNMADSIMSEEIFGPVLPLIKADYQTACEIIAKGEPPLGLYIFSTSQPEIDHILSHTSSGGVTINDLMFHAGIPGAPFGGVGNSGTGAYHGKYGFEAFSHRRTVVTVPAWFEYLVGFRYPPYDMKHISKLGAGKPGFRKGERMEDQVVGKKDSWIGLARGLGWQGCKLVGLMVLLSAVDARLSVKNNIVSLLLAVGGAVRTRLPA